MMSKPILFLLSLTLLTLTACKTNDNSSSIHDKNPIFLNETFYPGFSGVDDRGSIFYLLFESRRNAAKDPLIIQLTGGIHDCSSLISAFTENGPYRINQDNKTLSINPYSWNNIANVLYVDAPPGAGFSNVKTLDNTQFQVSRDLYYLLKNFLNRFPQYKGRDTYISAGLYGGHYGPHLGAYIMREGDLDLRLKGVLVGNGIVIYYSQYPPTADFALENKLVDQALYEDLVQKFKVCQDYTIHNQTEAAILQCNAQVQRIIGIPAKFNPYHIGEKCCYDFDSVKTFLAQSEVLKALGITTQTYNMCNHKVSLALVKEVPLDYTRNLAYLVQNGVKVLVYHGDKTLRENWRGGEALANNITWNQMNNFKKLAYSKYESSGEYKSIDPLTFYRVYNAGVLTARDQPEAALKMVDRFIKGW